MKAPLSSILERMKDFITSRVSEGSPLTPLLTFCRSSYEMFPFMGYFSRIFPVTRKRSLLSSKFFRDESESIAFFPY